MTTTRAVNNPVQARPGAGRLLQTMSKPFAGGVAIAAFVLWAHLGSGLPTFRSHVSPAPGWQQFRASYGVDTFGADSYFTRAVQNGYNLFYYTHDYGGRFTRKTTRDAVHACAGCHKVEELAYGFVNSDRFDAKLGRRISFEERVMRCYAGSMDGFVPTLYDPAIRDIRILARAIAHHLQLSEGARKHGG
jgi:cytochrome c